MADHSSFYETRDGAVRKHRDTPGHMMDLENATSVYHSDCYYTRVTAEAALIHMAPTIQGNTASASNNNNDLVAPVICRSTKFNWQKLANTIPHLNTNAVHYRKRHLFGNQNVTRPRPDIRPLDLPTPVAHRTRRRLHTAQQLGQPNL